MFKVRVRGPMACFTRPELKTERVSYKVMTPSAARGILETILWKPAIRWNIDQIDVLAPVRWFNLMRNEVTSKASPRVPYLIASDPTERAQRNTLGLRDVDYVIHASFEMTHRAGPHDSHGKFTEMFQRRLNIGQFYRPQCLGLREFSADVEPAPERYEPIRESEPLGLMPWGWEPTLDGSAGAPLFFSAVLREGSVVIPTLAEARRFTARNVEARC